MSATTPSNALGDAGETLASASLPSANDDRSSIDRPGGPITALAIEVLHGHIGCAVFSEEEQQLLLCEDLPYFFAFRERDSAASARRAQSSMQDDQEGGNTTAAAAQNAVPGFGHPSHGFIESLLAQFEPHLIVVSSKCPDPLRDMLRNFAEQRNGTYDLRDSKTFQVALGLSSIEEATAYSRHRHAGDEARGNLEESPLSAVVVLDAKVATTKSALAISCVGPLMSSLRCRQEVGRSLTLVSLCLDDYLFVDENTLKSLSIYSSDVHGFVHAKQGREGFSILDSQPLLRRWIMLPLARREEIVRRHEAVELLVRLETASEMPRIKKQLGEFGALPQICHTVNMGLGTTKTWINLLKTCNAVMNIRAELNSLELSRSELLKELKEQVVTESLQELADSINQIIDFEESKAQGKVTVRTGIDAHLDDLRQQLAILPQHLDRVAADLRREAAFRPTQGMHVVYFPQIGYLICVPAGGVIDMLADSTLEQQFSSPENVYLKNNRMTSLDHDLGDIASFVVDKEIEILDGLQTLVKECSPTLLAAHAAITQIDCLVAFARAATLYDLKRPRLVEEQVLHLKGSRHALKALSDESFVPNDIHLQGGLGLPARTDEQAVSTDRSTVASRAGEDAGRASVPEHSQTAATSNVDEKYSVMVLTGANSSGKSCLLQQAALAVFLSQCGSFVPAAYAELGVFDKILTRMRQDESVASEGSSFTRELGRLHRAMAMSTKRSLVILDEVGRECRSDDGAGLFIATIFDFLHRGPDCPVVLSATHHLRAIERHLPPSLPIQRAHMQTLLLPTLAESHNSLTYLYRLKPGFAGTSHACHCARLCGVPESVVERADRITRIGLRACHDAEAVKDEQIVRRLLGLRLGNEGEGEEQVRDMDDDAAKRLIQWVLEGDEEEMEGELFRGGMSVSEVERASAGPSSRV
uniref:MSH5 n=1 Tax=Kalmanozyma brasiliensis TaxID=1392244 RepID=A0AA48P8T3_9BASI|nr:TPA_inf: MSH5 [Kalmanozyma brasiliensis]